MRTPPKIIIDSDIPFIRGVFDNVAEVSYCKGNEITSDTLAEAQALIIRTRTKCDRRLLQDSKVKFIATATIGTDHIDSSWCRENGIEVASAPGCNAPGVAQYVFSSLFKTDFDPATDTLGIIGHGNVGSIVADWANQLGIKTIICDSPKKESGENGVEYADINKLLRESDAVTLHVPLTRDGKYPTYKMIGERELEMMKDGAVIINSSRGGVIEEKYLKKFLDAGKLTAIIDVWEKEPAIDKSLLAKTFITTPHIAGYSLEGKIRGTWMVVKAVENYLGLCGDHSGIPEIKNHETGKMTRDRIERSYDPISDSVSLKEAPDSFESLRNHYQYRHEP